VGKIRVNILSNFASSAWNTALSLVFVPLYIGLMGVEAYGLVGFYAMLQGLTACLDFGLSTTINREMAKSSVGNVKPENVLNLVRTLEVVYWLLAFGVGLAVFLVAPYSKRGDDSKLHGKECRGIAGPGLCLFEYNGFLSMAGSYQFVDRRNLAYSVHAFAAELRAPPAYQCR